MILIKKLDNYGVRGGNLLCFKSYLNNHKQFITYDNANTSLANISCGVARGSILGPLLFLLYINDFPNASSVLDLIMFVDNTNLFYFHSDIGTIFSTANMELGKIKTGANQSNISSNITFLPCWMKCWNSLRNYKIYKVSKKKKKIMLDDVG